MRKSKPQTPITVKLSCDEITEAVKWYYKELGKTDLALAAAIQAVRQDVSEPSSGSFLAEVCLVADWGSIALKTFSFESRLNLANEITNCWPQLKSLHLAGNGSEAELKLLSETHLLQPIGNPNQQLSFVSKYLHWCVNPGFAIWDHYSRVAMGQKESRQLGRRTKTGRD